MYNEHIPILLEQYQQYFDKNYAEIKVSENAVPNN